MDGWVASKYSIGNFIKKHRFGFRVELTGDNEIYSLGIYINSEIYGNFVDYDFSETVINDYSGFYYKSKYIE